VIGSNVLFLLNAIETIFLRANSTLEFSHSLGQKRKNSQRAYVFRCSSNNGHLDVLPVANLGPTETVRRITGKALFSITALVDGTMLRLQTAQSFQMTDSVRLKLRRRANIMLKVCELAESYRPETEQGHDA
jgi:hypothetical protein